MSTTTMAKAPAKHDISQNDASEKDFLPDEEGESLALKRRILIVEDDEVNRKQLEYLLEADADLQIDGTSNGKIALEWLTERNYSIVLTDLRMAGLDGMDLIRGIQQRGLPVTV